MVAGGSYGSSSEFFPGPMSPAPSSYTSSRIFGGGGGGEGEYGFEGVAAASPGRGGGGGGGKASSSFPRGGFELPAVKASSVPASGLTTVLVVNAPSLGIRG